jgi:hypothetical protein
MSLRHPLASALLFTALFACKGAESGETTGKVDAAPSEKAAPVDPPPVEPDNVAPEVTPTGGTETDTGDEPEPLAPLPATFEQVGVDVCDQYVADYGKCIDSKMPEAEREAARRIVFDNVTSWKQTASAPTGQKSLQIACRSAREQAKRATEALKCEW